MFGERPRPEEMPWKRVDIDSISFVAVSLLAEKTGLITMVPGQFDTPNQNRAHVFASARGQIMLGRLMDEPHILALRYADGEELPHPPDLSEVTWDGPVRTAIRDKNLDSITGPDIEKLIEEIILTEFPELKEKREEVSKPKESMMRQWAGSVYHGGALHVMASILAEAAPDIQVMNASAEIIGTDTNGPIYKVVPGGVRIVGYDERPTYRILGARKSEGGGLKLLSSIARTPEIQALRWVDSRSGQRLIPTQGALPRVPDLSNLDWDEATKTAVIEHGLHPEKNGWVPPYDITSLIARTIAYNRPDLKLPELDKAKVQIFSDLEKLKERLALSSNITASDRIFLTLVTVMLSRLTIPVERRTIDVSQLPTRLRPFFGEAGNIVISALAPVDDAPYPAVGISSGNIFAGFQLLGKRLPIHFAVGIESEKKEADTGGAVPNNRSRKKLIEAGRLRSFYQGNEGYTLVDTTDLLLILAGSFQD